MFAASSRLSGQPICSFLVRRVYRIVLRGGRVPFLDSTVLSALMETVGGYSLLVRMRITRMAESGMKPYHASHESIVMHIRESHDGGIERGHAIRNRGLGPPGMVLGLPRGGVPVAFGAAHRNNMCPFYERHS